MPAPKKNEAKNVSGVDEALKKAQDTNEEIPEEIRIQLKTECRTLKSDIQKEERMTGQFNDERLRINYFWLISKKELEDK